jgi:hypothetical protein
MKRATAIVVIEKDVACRPAAEGGDAPEQKHPDPVHLPAPRRKRGCHGFGDDCREIESMDEGIGFRPADHLPVLPPSNRVGASRALYLAGRFFSLANVGL